MVKRFLFLYRFVGQSCFPTGHKVDLRIVVQNGVSKWTTRTFSENPLTTNLPIVSEGVLGLMHLFKRILLFQLEQAAIISTPFQLEDFANPSAEKRKRSIVEKSWWL